MKDAAGDLHFSCEEGSHFERLEQSVTDDAAHVLWQVTLPSGNVFSEECTVDKNGVHLKYTCEDKIFVCLPALEGDGWRKSEINVSGCTAAIRYEGFECRYAASAPIELTPERYGNRNGHYRALQLCAEGSAMVHISIEKI